MQWKVDLILIGALILTGLLSFGLLEEPTPGGDVPDTPVFTASGFAWNN